MGNNYPGGPKSLQHRQGSGAEGGEIGVFQLAILAVALLLWFGLFWLWVVYP